MFDGGGLVVVVGRRKWRGEVAPEGAGLPVEAVGLLGVLGDERALRGAHEGAALDLEVRVRLGGLPGEERAADIPAEGGVEKEGFVVDVLGRRREDLGEEDRAYGEDAQAPKQDIGGENDRRDGQPGEQKRAEDAHGRAGELTRWAPQGLNAATRRPPLAPRARRGMAKDSASRDSMANWVLKFISGKYQGGEFPLEEGQEYYIGRSSDSDMVLVEDMVSRQHARIVVRDDVAMLEDLGSTNGSFVNGERVANKALEEGDRILFGTSIIKLMRVDGNASSGVSEEQTTNVKPVAAPKPSFEPPPEQSTVRQTMAMRPPTSTVSGMMSGLLEEVSLPDLLQLFSTSRKSGVLRLHDEPQRASVFLREGRVIFCEIEGQNLPPDKAAFRVMTWTKGMFVLEPPVDRHFEVELEMSTEAMMMEAMRLMDEMENIRHSLPEMDARIALRSPLEPPLRGLTPELLDTLQLAINANTVGDVLNTSVGGDLETLQDLDYLIKHGYLEQS